MAKLKAHKKRRIRLRRWAVVLLAIVALLATAIGIVTLRIKAIVLSALRKELPNCEVTVGRVTLNPFSNLKVYDLRIEDRSTPGARSIIELDHAVAHYSVAALLKFDIDLDVSRPTVVLDSTGGAPFPDVFEREPAEGPSRFRLRQFSVREGRATLAGPGLQVEASFEAQASGLGTDGGGLPAEMQCRIHDGRITLGGAGYRLDASFEAQASTQGSGAGAAPADVRVKLRDVAFASRSPEAEGAVTNTVRVGRLDAALGYDAAQPELLDRLLLHEVSASDCSVAVLYPDFRLTGTLDLGLANDTGDVYGQPTKLAVSSDDFQLEAGSLMTRQLSVLIDADIHAGREDQALDISGTLTAAGLDADLDGLLDKAGLQVTTLFHQHDAEQLVGLFVDDEDHHIPVIQDFDSLEGNIERFELALSYTPVLGFGLAGAIAADGLEGSSSALMLDIEGIAVDSTFSLLPPERGAPLEFVVGDPDAEAGPGRIVARTVTWKAGDMEFPVDNPRAHLTMADFVWTIGDLLGVLFEGEGTGTIQALADGTVTLDLQFEGVNMAPLFAEVSGKTDDQSGVEPDQMTGYADAKVLITLKSTEDGTTLHNISAEMRTRPPGGVLKLKKKEESFSSLPGGDQVLGAVKQQMSPRFYDHFLEKFKNYQYESITIEARKSGDEYVLDVKIRDADTKNPLPVDLTIRYSYKHIYHDGPPSQEEATRE